MNEPDWDHLHWRRVLREFLPEDAATAQCQRCSGGFSAAIVVKVTVDDASYALRGWPVGGFPEARIRELHRFLSHLQAAGIPVAVPVASRTWGETLVTVRGQDWQLEPWRAGTAPTPETVTLDQLTAIMTLLARLHAHALRYHSSPSGSKWFQVVTAPVPALRERREVIREWDGVSLRRIERSLASAPSFLREPAAMILDGFRRLALAIDAELATWQDEHFELLPCFRDLWSAHVLMVGNEVTGLIDPAATRTDHPGTDLSRLLGSLLGNDDARWQAALAAYQRFRPLSAADLAVIKALDRSSVLLSGMTWLRRFDSGEVPRQSIADVAVRLSGFARRLSQMTE